MTVTEHDVKNDDDDDGDVEYDENDGLHDGKQ